jgi:hypothetical protein
VSDVVSWMTHVAMGQAGRTFWGPGDMYTFLVTGEEHPPADARGGAAPQRRVDGLTAGAPATAETRPRKVAFRD